MDERALADRLDRWLDECAAGRAGDDAGVDPEIARVAHRYRLLGQSPPPPDARGRVWRRLQRDVRSAANVSQIDGAMTNGRAAMEAPMDFAADPRPRELFVPRAPRAWRSRFAPLAAMVVLSLVAATGYLAVARDDDDGPRTIPAVAVASPAPGEPVIDTLFTATLPASQLPRGDGVTAGLAVYTVPLGHQAKWEPPCCPGAMIEYVVEGAYGVRAEAAIEVVRASGAVERIAAGTETILAAGDGLISRNETVVEVWNAGDAPIVLLNWMMIDGAEGHFVPGWIAGPANVRSDLPPAGQPVTVTLLRVTEPDGGEITIEVPGAVHFGVRMEDSRGWVATRSGGGLSIGAESGLPFVAYVMRLEPDPSNGAPPVSQREASDSP